MSRFRLPARVAPSPAAEEPGLQNSAARLRSSREVQSRILAERRAPEVGLPAESIEAQLPDLPTSPLAELCLQRQMSVFSPALYHVEKYFHAFLSHLTHWLA